MNKKQLLEAINTLMADGYTQKEINDAIEEAQNNSNKEEKLKEACSQAADIIIAAIEDYGISDNKLNALKNVFNDGFLYALIEDGIEFMNSPLFSFFSEDDCDCALCSCRKAENDESEKVDPNKIIENFVKKICE